MADFISATYEERKCVVSHRSHTWAHLTFAITLVLWMLSIGTVLAQGDKTTQPAFASPGTFKVGKTNLVIDKGSKDPITVIVRYPAIIKEGDTGPYASKDAAPDKSNAPYPLIILSPRAGGTDSQQFLAEHLVSWGFVVLVPSHTGDGSLHAYPALVKRLLDVKRVINYAETLTADEGQLNGMIDIEKLAVAGASYGGKTAYGAAGVSLNWTAVEQYCTEFPKLDWCADLPAQKAEMKTIIGTDASAGGTWPAIWDERVKAIIPMAGSFELYGKENVATIKVPVLIMAAELDIWSPKAWNIPAYEQVASTQKGLLVFQGGMHSLFDQANGDGPVHDLIKHFATAFLLDVLKGDKEAAKALTPDAVSFPGIEYKAQGF